MKRNSSIPSPHHRGAVNHQGATPAAGPESALFEIERSMDEAWVQARQDSPGGSDEEAARLVVADPSRHQWRLVDAALDRLPCPDCEAALGRGIRGCPSCDMADGFRFAGQEPDRDGVPPGNEHAIRVSTAVLRSPHRYPTWAVRANEVHLPLFLAGEMPTRLEQEAMLAAWQRGVSFDDAGARTFSELATRAKAELAERSLTHFPLISLVPPWHRAE